MPIIAVQQTDDGFEYLLAKPQGTQWLVEDFGTWQPTALAANQGELWSSFFAEGLNSLGSGGLPLAGRKLLVCLKRPVVEFHRLDLERVDGVDLTDQIHNQVAVQERLDPDALILDYACDVAGQAELYPTFVTCLPRETWQQWDAHWRVSKSKPAMMVPRVWATWRLLRQEASLSNEPAIVVALYRKQADIYVLVRRRPVYVRAINLQQPDEAADVAQQLISEIRLTAGTVDLPGNDQTISSISIFGDRDFSDTVARQIQDSLDINSNIIALETLRSFVYVAGQTPDLNSAPLLGLLLGFTQSPDTETIDLMNPKRLQQPISRWRIYTWLAALIILGIGYLGFDWWQTYETTRQANLDLAKRNKEAQSTLDRTIPKARVVEYLQRWEAEQVNWLQQLDEITKSLPSGDEVVVRQYDGKRYASGAEISMQIQARNLETIEAIQQAVQKNGWQIKLKRQVETQDTAYPFRLETTISYNQEP